MLFFVLIFTMRQVSVVFSKCGVQSKRKCEIHESCVCIVRFSACVCQKKTECRHVAVLVAGPEPFIALKHIQATLYLIRFRMGSQSSLSVFLERYTCRVMVTGCQIMPSQLL